ncbi:hypothetical protein [Cytobacillus sp. NCCP-133]|uniref:hypothetical protein n=1 Tax=Cytobacillus sp. NCCP-133 TaxID=766848 RepID=UPI002231FC8C|nr:hypothetical protein [Cytobacillus sp. NCCP-133]GLB58689.1 hypothetical protein NCCP133_08220 [Cytobacillus sp. NCCP-133]
MEKIYISDYFEYEDKRKEYITNFKNILSVCGEVETFDLLRLMLVELSKLKLETTNDFVNAISILKNNVCFTDIQRTDI